MRQSATREQQAIVDLNDGSYLVTAPPGSGKTAVLMWRILRLLRQDPAASWRILALTFTTRAAQELRARVEAEIAREEGIPLRERLHASTIHSFCLDVLQHYGEAIAFPVPVSVYDEEDRLAALRQAVETAGIAERNGNELRGLLQDISKAKRSLKGPDDSWRLEDRLAFEAYERALALQGACDYDDLLRATWRLFSEQPRIARHYRRIFRYIMVDEAQDTSLAQYMVLRGMCGDDHGNVMLVADDRQAIYGFTGASAGYLERFVKEFEAQRIGLEGNFRCAKAIVRVANRLVAAMSDARPAKMVASGRAAGRVQLVDCVDEEDEAETVTKWVRGLLERGLDPDILEPEEETCIAPEAIAVLGRSRRNLQVVRDRLASVGIAILYHEGGRAAYEHPLIVLLVRGLRLVQNPKDEVTRAALSEAWGVKGDLWSGLKKATGMVRVLPELLEKASPEVDPAPMLDKMIDAVETEATKRPEDGEALSAEVEGFKEIVDEWKGRTAGSQRSLGSFLADLAMAGRAAITRPGVRLLTIHAVKGLEFRAVAVVGLDEGSLPDFRASDDAALEEERRNAYVAITRAARELHLTWPRVRSTRFGARTQQPSRFLSEMELI